MKLSAEQVEIIQDRIVRSGIRIESLRDDVLDHLCCVVESELDGVKNFNELLNKAIAELAPNGLGHLEKETVYLLNSKRIIRMKKVIYFTGFVGAVSLTIGTIFKWMHMPGADQLSVAGYVFLFFIFIPLAAIDRYKLNLLKAVSDRLRIIFGAASAVTGGIAFIFKMFHLQGFDFFFISAAILFTAGFLPLLFFTMYKKSIA